MTLPEETTAPVVKKSENWSFLELIRFAVIAALIVIPIRIFIAEPYLVRQTSMVPTFHNNDYLVVEKVSYRFTKPMRGDIVIFRSPVEKGRTLIKRIVGMPGETLVIDGQTTTVEKKDGEAALHIKEPYVLFPMIDAEGTYTLKSDEYFVMGDNRAGSFDSRNWGPIRQADIIGKPLLRMFPFSSIETWPGINVLPADYPRSVI